METRANYALIGAFLIAAFFALGGFVLWLAQLQFNQEYAEYDVVFAGAVNGLSEGGEVRYLGIKVGEIDDLSFDPENATRVVARIRVDSETPLREDSEANLDFQGLTGVTFIQLRPGSPDSPRLPVMTGENVPVIKTELTQFEEIISGGQELMADAMTTMELINAFLSPDNARSLRDSLANIERLTGTFADDTQLLEDLKKTIATFNDAGAEVTRIAASLDGLGETANTELEAISAEARALIEDARGVIQRADAVVSETGEGLNETREAIEGPAVEATQEARLLVQDMRLLVRRLDQVTRELEQNPQALIQGNPVPYTETIQ